MLSCQKIAAINSTHDWVADNFNNKWICSKCGKESYVVSEPPVSVSSGPYSLKECQEVIMRKALG